MKPFHYSVGLRVVGHCSDLLNAQKLCENFKRCPSNLRLWSIVMNFGTPKRKIQQSKRPLAPVSAFWSGTENTSSLLKKRSMTVRRSWLPLEGGRGPTMSQFKWENFSDGRENVPRLFFVLRWTFDCWLPRHARVHLVTSGLKS
ncbi:hypothetical protein TNIN_365081 [Trichonephila inaurata madagascariensis]|uniref:Uncharacterized protein n=1 Tax=Trichonephila inaurata madagascariensis TaxID=2747483 RepID=A0A8X6KIG8_9ARAC|nr:hypothetical protein TNIN_365081 [Trichonephila inaurata madagascariensis]